MHIASPDVVFPDYMLCPITHTVMVCPTVVHGQTYEKSALREWLATNPSCPKTRRSIDPEEPLDTNVALKQVISEFIEKHGAPFDWVLLASTSGDADVLCALAEKGVTTEKGLVALRNKLRDTTEHRSEIQSAMARYQTRIDTMQEEERRITDVLKQAGCAPQMYLDRVEMALDDDDEFNAFLSVLERRKAGVLSKGEARIIALHALEEHADLCLEFERFAMTLA